MQPKFTIKVPSRKSEDLEKKIRAATERAVKKAAPRIRAAIIEQASAAVQQALGSSGVHYRRALREPSAVVVDTTHTQAVITVNIKDPLVLAIENGQAPYDLKAPILAARGKASKRGSIYADVPIRARNNRIMVRRVSTNSSPQSWIHPGFKAARVFTTIKPSVRATSLAILREVFTGDGVKVK